MEDGLYAKMHTQKGEVLIKLEFEKTPVTVANFVGLAEGTIPNSLKAEGEPYYDGLNFHRVISVANGDGQDFMVQGGCPEGSGRGNPGYSFQDEFHSELVHDRPGILSMANAGPASNGSQFFITITPTPHLDNAHTVFGNVVEGQDIVIDDILTGDLINKVEIIREGSSAENFDAKKVFTEGARLSKR